MQVNKLIVKIIEGLQLVLCTNYPKHTRSCHIFRKTVSTHFVD